MTVKRELPVAPKPKKPVRIRSLSERPTYHSAIPGVREDFFGARENDDGYLKPAKRKLLDLIVSKGALDRAIAVANELFLSLEDRGHSVVIAPREKGYSRAAFDEREKPGSNIYRGLWQPMRPTVVFIGTVAIGLTLFEISEEVKVKRVNGKYVPIPDTAQAKSAASTYTDGWVPKRDIPSGRLCLQAYSPYSGTKWVQQWREAKGDDIQTKFTSIVKTLEQIAPAIASQVAKARQQEAAERELREQQYQRFLIEEKKRVASRAEKESRDALLKIIEDWKEARQLEDFFSDMEQKAKTLNVDDSQQALQRVNAARKLLARENTIKQLLSWKTPIDRLAF